MKNIASISLLGLILMVAFVSPAIAQTLSAPSNVNLGESVTVTGSCPTGSVSAIPVIVTQNDRTDTVGSATFGNSGTNFTGMASFGLFSNLVSGPATLSVLCPGTNVSTATSINFVAGAGNPTNNGNNSGNKNTLPSGGVSAGTGANADNMNESNSEGISASTTPVGGVAAGGSDNALTFSMMLLILGLIGLTYNDKALQKNKINIS